MRSRADALERRLVRLEAGDDLGELQRQGVTRTVALARELAIAGAIRREGARIDAVAVAAAVALIVGILIGLVPRLHLATQDVVDRAVRATLSQEAQIHVRLAETRLTDLADALHSGRVGGAPELARALSMERSTALALGADVTGLDRKIRATIPSALARTPHDVALGIRSILGTLLASPGRGEAPGSKTPSKERGTGSGSPAAPRQPGDGSPQPGSGGGSLLPPLPPLPPLPLI